MRKTIFAIAAVAVLMPGSLMATPVTKGQACEKLALKETYPIAMRGKCQIRLTGECKRLVDGWMAAASAEKRRCINAPRGDLK